MVAKDEPSSYKIIWMDMGNLQSTYKRHKNTSISFTKDKLQLWVVYVSDGNIFNYQSNCRNKFGWLWHRATGIQN